MSRTPVRIAVLVLGLLVTAGLAYRANQDEAALKAARQAALMSDQAVNQTAELLLDIRASLHAYVAPGQGLPFWGKRAQEGIETLRPSLTELDQMVSPAGGSLTQSIEAVNQLAAAERRARTYVSRGELQLAGDVIFTEVRDVLAAMTSDVQSIRAGLRREHDRQAAQLRQAQLMLAGGALAVWVLIALVLVPVKSTPAARDPNAWREELKETLQKPAPVAAGHDPELEALDAPAVPALPVAAPAPAAPVVAAVPLSALTTVSEICADLSALSDPGALPGALERIDGVLNATGLIVWVASTTGDSLTPVATHGFDPRIVQRIGAIPRDSANLTASAFRENVPKTSAATAAAPGAVAVPMCGPSGPSGVLSIELRSGQPVDDATVALASILAAQLATLTMPLAPAEAVEEPPAQRAAI